MMSLYDYYSMFIVFNSYWYIIVLYVLTLWPLVYDFEDYNIILNF